MSRLRTWSVLFGLGSAALLAAQGSLWAQEALSAKLDPSGMVRVFSGETELAMVELNAHAVGWVNAPQASATAQARDLPAGAGKRFTGTLAIPAADGGAVAYTQTVKALPQGLELEYEVGFTKAMKLSGLQVSINLPTTIFGGKDLVVSNPDADPRTVALPSEQAGDAFQLFFGDGSKVEAAKGTPQAVSAELRAAASVVVQDLRRWERQTFEVRFPAIMEDAGRDVTPEDRLHLDLTLTFAAPVKLTGP